MENEALAEHVDCLFLIFLTDHPIVSFETFSNCPENSDPDMSDSNVDGYTSSLSSQVHRADTTGAALKFDGCEDVVARCRTWRSARWMHHRKRLLLGATVPEATLVRGEERVASRLQASDRSRLAVGSL